MSKDGLKSLILLFYLATLGFAITGLVFGFYYPEYDSEFDLGSKFNHTVGGDAYNYIIMAGRGLIWIGLSIISAIVASTLNIGYYLIVKNNEKLADKPETNATKIQATENLEANE